MTDNSSMTAVKLLVIDEETVRFTESIDDWDVVTLVGCMSEDPVNWSEIALVWPRYRTAHSPEFVDALPLREASLEDALQAFDGSLPWVAIDLPSKRIFGGGGYDEIPSDACFGMDEDDERFDSSARVSIHLPPWWEVINESDVDRVQQARTSRISIPNPRRDVLWGRQLADGLAALLFREACSAAWDSDHCDMDVKARHAHTVAVHRDWLMTPHADLDGRMPRQCLHGGMHWLDRVMEGFKFHVTKDCELVPISPEMQTYKNGPMGREEICMYFDLCRELIDAGWNWIVAHREQVDAGKGPQKLAQVLAESQDAWMDELHEDESAPAVILRSERQRVPRVAGGEGEDCHVDCDCPICAMMADGAFGPMFVGIDGYHLELDDEFAFSLCETREEWEEHQRAFGERDAAIEAEEVEDEADDETDDPFGSPWRNSYVDWEEMQQGPMANMAIGFLLADMITELQMNKSPQADIDELNEAFRIYRSASGEKFAMGVHAFQKALEEVAGRNPFLVPRSADLQSKLDELSRSGSTLLGDDLPY